MQNVELVLGTSVEDQPEDQQAVVLAGAEAAKHKLVTGVTGSGKSKFLAGVAVQLLNQRVGFILLDPAGDLCDDVLSVLLEPGYFGCRKDTGA